MRHLLVWTVILLVASPSCSAQRGQREQKDRGHDEDLAIWRIKARPKIYADTLNRDTTLDGPHEGFRMNINEQLDPILDSIRHLQLTRKFIDGFTIQLYSGPRRELAMEAKKTLSDYYPQLTGDLVYQQPNFRVKVGRYFTRMEAYRDFSALKRNFGAAIIIPEKILVR